MDTPSLPRQTRMATILVRVLLIAVGLAAWFWTQALIGQRSFPNEGIGDLLLDLLAPVHRYLTDHAEAADGLLIISSLLIDALGVFLLAWSILGPSLRPFVGLLILFGLRQLCQASCALPPPAGMIWRDPGFPSLLVTYGVANDLFFSGHTALAVYGSVEIIRLRRPLFISLGVGIALFEVAAVLVLQAHYTMDVYAGAITALWVAAIAGPATKWIEGRLVRLRTRQVAASGPTAKA